MVQLPWLATRRPPKNWTRRSPHLGHHGGMAEDPLSLHTEVIDRISRIDDRQGPALIRDLLHAEATRSRVSPALIEMSTAVHRPDGGIDGRTYFDFDLPVIAAPAGHLVWQVKTGNEKPSASKELGKSAKHHDAQDAISDGAHYILVWTSDQPSTARETVLTAFKSAAKEIRPDAAVFVLTAENVADWVWSHPVVLAELLPLGGLQPLGPLTGTEVENGTTDIENRIRQYLSFPTRRALRVVGPVGQGKKTAIKLAASTMANPVEILVAADPDAAPIQTLTSLAQRGAVLAVIVQRCPPERAAAPEHLVAVSDGNLRLITEGVDAGGGYLQATDIVHVRPMLANIDRRLLEALGTPPALTAELIGTAGGNPRLLSAIAQGDEPADGALERVTEGLDGRALSAFALMPPLDPSGISLSTVSSIFDVSERDLEDTATECARRNFIPWSGYTRLPRAIAAFAIARAFRERQQWLLRSLERLPDEWVAPAIAPLASAGPIARTAVEDLLRRSDALPVQEDDDPESAFGLLDRLALASAAASAAPDAAFLRLCDITRRYPWRDRATAGFTIVAGQDVVHAARRIDRAQAGSGTLGAQLVLETIAASGFEGGHLRTGLRELLHPEAPDYAERIRHLTVIAASLGSIAIRAVESAVAT